MNVKQPWEQFAADRGPQIVLTDDDGDIQILYWMDITKLSRSARTGSCRVGFRRASGDYDSYMVKESLADIYEQAGVPMPERLKQKLAALEKPEPPSRPRTRGP